MKPSTIFRVLSSYDSIAENASCRLPKHSIETTPINKHHTLLIHDILHRGITATIVQTTLSTLINSQTRSRLIKNMITSHDKRWSTKHGPKWTAPHTEVFHLIFLMCWCKWHWQGFSNHDFPLKSWMPARTAKLKRWTLPSQESCLVKKKGIA